MTVYVLIQRGYDDSSVILGIYDSNEKAMTQMWTMETLDKKCGITSYEYYVEAHELE